MTAAIIIYLLMILLVIILTGLILRVLYVISVFLFYEVIQPLIEKFSNWIFNKNN